MRISPDALEQVDREIAVLADHLARHRDLIEQMRSEGKCVEAAQSALEALAEIFRQRLKERQALLEAEGRADTLSARAER